MILFSKCSLGPKFALLCSVLCLGMIAGYAQDNPDNLSKTTNVDSLFTQAQIALDMNGDVEKAENLFKRIITLQPRNAVAHAQLSAIYQNNENYTTALSEIQKAANLDTANTDYQNQLGILLTQTGEYDKAAEIFALLAKAANDPTDFLMKEAFCYNLAKEYQKALDVISKLKPASKKSEEQLLKDKLKLYVHLDKMDSVVSVAHQMIRFSPDEPANYIITSVSEDFLGRGKDAVRTIDSALKRFPKNPKVVQQAIKLFIKYDHPQLEQFYERMIKSELYSEKEKTIMFYPLAEVMQKDTFANKILTKNLPKLAFGTPPNESAILLYSAVAMANGNLEKAASVCKKGIAVDSGNVLMWNGLLQIYQRLGKSDSVQLYNEIALKRFPDSRVPHFYEALIKYTLGDTAATIAALEQSKELNQQDSIIPDFSIYTFLGDLYEAMGSRDSASVNYQEALKIDPNAISLLNNYSYLLAEQGNNLDTALSMSAKTLAVSPNEPMFLDTYGWILFKQKKYEEAKDYIEKAIQHSDKPDAAIYEHLGDVENALGDTRSAKKHWKKSLKLGNHSLELKEKLEK